MNNKIILLIIILFIPGCSEKQNPVISSSQYKDYAHGFWEAARGDIEVTNEIGLIVYNWYAIDTKSNGDSLYVTWDDGIACTKTSAIMKENMIEMQVNEIHAKFIIIDEKEAFVIFKTDENIYQKQLLKVRDDPSVLCE
ncbi:hypothetical protein JW824_14375 [bacterium]|nr:hypothetical protein [bacterium]